MPVKTTVRIIPVTLSTKVSTGHFTLATLARGIIPFLSVEIATAPKGASQ